MLDKFLSYLKNEKNYSKHTISAYKTDLTQFLNFIKKDIVQITREDILDFIEYLKSINLSTVTTNRKLQAIKKFYKFLMIEGVVNINPADLVETAKIKKSVPKFVTVEQYKHILSIIDNLEDKALIELLFNTGIRREEVVNLKRSDINFDLNTITIHGKGKKERVIPFIPKLLPNTTLWLKQHNNEWVFPSEVNLGEPKTVRWVNKIVKKWSTKAGYSNITPHAFRHSFGTYLYDNGADIKAIQEMMGHESIDTTNIYAKSSAKRNKQEYLKAHPLLHQ